MFPTNPAVTDGVEIFVWIVVVLISLVGAVSIIDYRQSKKELNIRVFSVITDFIIWNKDCT